MALDKEGWGVPWLSVKSRMTSMRIGLTARQRFDDDGSYFIAWQVDTSFSVS
jgi:hypothetical protein